jgi:hypothetical protein
MQTIKLRINERIYDRLLGILSKFNKDEIEIIPEDAEYLKNQKYLESELNEIVRGKAGFIDIEEAEKRLEEILAKDEGTI